MMLVSAGAAGQARADDFKIGAINAQRIREQAPQFDSLRAELEKEFGQRDRDLVAQQKKLKDMEDRIAKDSAIMSETERKNLERDIINARRDLKRGQDEFREDFTFRQNEEIGKIQKEIVDAIQTVAKQNNFDLVVSEGVIYASPKMDMTDLVIDYLKKKRAGTAQAPAPAAPAKK